MLRSKLILRALETPIPITTSSPLSSRLFLPFTSKYEGNRLDNCCNLRRLTTTSCPSSSARVKQTFSMNRASKTFDKLMSGKRNPNSPSHFRSNPSQNLEDFDSLTKGAAGGAGVGRLSPKVMRRVNVLNTVFIEHITGLLATGEVSPEFLGLGVQIARVKIKTDFSGVNVYWYSTGSIDKDEKIEKLLDATGGQLRHIMCGLRVIGVVPPIKFFKDSSLVKFQEVESILEKCDTGKDRFTLKDNEDDNEEEEETLPEDLPPETQSMRQDMLGVKHDLIMNEIMKAIKSQRERKAMKEQRLSESRGTEEPSTKLSDAMEEYEDHRKRQREFLKYLHQRQADKSRLMKMLTVEAKEREFMNDDKMTNLENQRQRRLDELDKCDELDDEDPDPDEYYNQEEEYYQNFREDFK